MKTFKIILSLFSIFFTFQSAAQEAMIGEIRMFAGNFAPRGWAFCDGQLLAINSNSALFSILGTTYGGDGRTTFALPDLRSRTAVHEGTGPGLSPVRLGEKGGTDNLYLNVNNLPSHSHTGYIRLADTQGDMYYGGGAYIADSSNVEYKQYSNTAPNGAKNVLGVQTNPTGGNQPIYSKSPYTGINYIIALYGIFPPRN